MSITDSSDQTDIKKKMFSEVKEEQEEATSQEDLITIDTKDKTIKMIEHSTEEEDTLKEKTEVQEGHKEEDMMVIVINDE